MVNIKSADADADAPKKATAGRTTEKVKPPATVASTNRATILYNAFGRWFKELVEVVAGR